MEQGGDDSPVTLGDMRPLNPSSLPLQRARQKQCKEDLTVYADASEGHDVQRHAALTAGKTLDSLVIIESDSIKDACSKLGCNPIVIHKIASMISYNHRRGSSDKAHILGLSRDLTQPVKWYKVPSLPRSCGISNTRSTCTYRN